jgi:hypothetical protein
VNLLDLEKLVQRIARMRQHAHDKAGPGFEWDYTFPDGETHTYTVNAVKPPEVVADDFANWCVWAWSLKDYLKLAAAQRGRQPRDVEDLVNRDRNLQLCADLANRDKHAEPARSRSGLFPRLGKVAYSMTKEGLASLVVGAFSVTLNVREPRLVQVSLPIEDQQGNRLGDAFEVLDAAVRRWEELMVIYGVAP